MKFGWLPYRDRPGIGGGIARALCLFDIPTGGNRMSEFGSVAGSVSWAGGTPEVETLLRFLVYDKPEQISRLY